MGLKIFKKITVAMMCFALAAICAFSVGAVAITYTIPEIDDMTITMPDGITAVTRDSSETDKYFSLFGIDYKQTMENFEKGNIYLQGMDENSETTITVTMTQTDESKGISNYNLLSKEKLGEVQANFLSQDEYTKCTVEDGDKIVWLYFDINVNESGKTIKAYQANTVYDGKSVNITLQRNGGDVTQADYNTFSLIVSATDFKQFGSFNSLWPYILIGCAIIAVLVIIFIIAVARHASHKRKKNKNDKLIEELADKYTTRRGNMRSYSDGTEFDEYTDISSSSEKPQPVQEETAQPEQAEDLSKKYDLENYRSDVKRYSDEEINELLGIEPEKQEEAEEKPEEPKKEEPFVTAAELSKDDQISEFFESVEQEKREAAAETEEKAEQNNEEKNEEKTLEDAATRKFEKISEASGEDDDVQIYSRSSDRKTAEAKKSDEQDIEESDEYEDFNNDEVLVRDEAKHKFSDGYDFFEEAPKKTMGVISSEDIRDAEDYDVINEVEKKASEVEKSGSGAGETVAGAMKKFGAALKSFGVHCGYFVTNLSRSIKRKRAAKKRKKAEEERRARARARAARQRQQEQDMQNGKLVQVHSRGSRPPQQRRPTQQRRPSQQRSSSQHRRPAQQRKPQQRRPDNRG